MDQEEQEFRLITLLNEHTVRARVAVADWEQATEAVGQLLVDAGKIDAGYIEAMKRVLKELGPYAVIAPGIVLLHARPEDGVLSPCLGLITLTKPVEFGHSENDPVDIVLALGATDKKTHISALQQLAMLLGDEKGLELIRSAPDSRTLLENIHTWANTGGSS
jgi:PTS system ascorbate-specific IIA component